MRYNNTDFSELRLYIYQQGHLHHLDVTMEAWGPSFEKAEEYEDRSIFNEKKFGQKMQQYFEPLREFIHNEKTDGNQYPNALFAFPDKEPRNICIFKKEVQAFMIYDIY